MQEKTPKPIDTISANVKDGAEPLSYNNKPTNYNLLDFWRWSVSDLLSNTTRGRLAEFIVGTAIGLDPNNLREEWDNYDLVTRDGTTIEVKSAAYLQSWRQDKLSSISFSIKPTHAWTEENGRSPIAKRQADIYVFCLLKHKDPKTIDPLKLEQWDFFVVPTERLNKEFGEQERIGLTTLIKLAEPITYKKLRNYF